MRTLDHSLLGGAGFFMSILSLVHLNVINVSHDSIGNVKVDQTPPSRSLRSVYEYLEFAYDVLEILTEDNPMSLEHEDRNQPKDCMFVKTEEGVYSYLSPGYSDAAMVCGLYIIGEPTQLVEFEFLDFGVSCNDGGLVSVVDGWELNGKFFPSESDHELPREKRFEEFCGTKSPSKVFVTSQNVGLIEFRIPVKTQGFRVQVKFRDNPYPCNVMLQVPNGLYTLRNYGRPLNCTASVLFPSSVTLLNMDIGETPEGLENIQVPGQVNQTSEASLIVKKKCKENGCQDYFEVRVGDDLDPLLMSPVTNFCGTFNSAQLTSSLNATRVDVECGNTAVRLVSSGKRENSVTLFLDLYVDLDSKPCPRRSRRHSHDYRRRR